MVVVHNNGSLWFLFAIVGFLLLILLAVSDFKLFSDLFRKKDSEDEFESKRLSEHSCCGEHRSMPSKDTGSVEGGVQTTEDLANTCCESVCGECVASDPCNISPELSAAIDKHIDDLKADLDEQTEEAPYVVMADVPPNATCVEGARAAKPKKRRTRKSVKKKTTRKKK